jgi:dipeptidyl-peptidase-4
MDEANAGRTGGTEERPHGVAEFVAQEEFGRASGFFVSPDSELVAFEEPDQSKVEHLHVADPGHPEQDPDKTYYPRVGTPNAEVRFGIVPIKGGATKWVTWDRVKFPYVTTVRWDKGAPLTMYVLDRAQKNGQLLAVDAKTGQTRVLLTEHDDAWLEVDPSVPRWLPDGSAFYWSTQRSGSWELEERQLQKGAGETSARTVVPRETGYRELLHVDPEHKHIVIAAGTEPSEQSLFVVPSGGGAAERVPSPAGVTRGHFGKNHERFVATYGTLGELPRTVVASLGKPETRELASAAEKPASLPAVEIRKVGPDAIRVAIVRPKDFKSGLKYPVIDAAYGGPTHKVAVADASRFVRAQAIADAAGAIVVAIDGKGTPKKRVMGAMSDPLDEVARKHFRGRRRRKLSAARRARLSARPPCVALAALDD